MRLEIVLMGVAVTWAVGSGARGQAPVAPSQTRHGESAATTTAPEPTPPPADEAAPAPKQEPAPEPAKEEQATEPPPTEAPTVFETATQGDRTPGWFKKGELAAVGALGLVPWDNRAGLLTQIERFRELFYLAFIPTVNVKLPIESDVIEDTNLTMSFGVPLRFQLLDTTGQTNEQRFGDAFKFRTEDWDWWEDYFKIIRFITLGRKEDHVYLNINQFRSATLGHGTIMKRYNPNLSIDVTRVSLEFDGFSDWVGGELFLNSIPIPNQLGGLLFVKPLSFADRDNYILRSVSIGAQVMADWDAPIVNKLDVADEDKDGRRGEILIGGPNRQPQYFSAGAVAYGLDGEVKFYKSPDKSVDIKAYFDWSRLRGEVPRDCASWKEQDPRCPALFPETNDPVTLVDLPEHVETREVTSDGLSVGLLGRFTLGDDKDHAIRVRTEFRGYAGNYLPSYFDTLYQVHRLQYATSREPLAQNPAHMPKLRKVLERDGQQSAFGFYTELSYAYWNWFEAAFGMEFNTLTDDNSLFFHIGVPRWKFISFFATFHQRNAAFKDLLQTLRNTVFIAEARFFVLPFLYLRGDLITPFGFGEDNEFQQVFDLNVAVEISFGWD
jgi:hypothetical protein